MRAMPDLSTSEPTNHPSLSHLPLVALAIFSLLAAMWAGLLRLGWQFPPLSETLAGVHGPLMISGFLGTLVSLERAVALRLKWTYAVPLFSSLGALALMAGAFFFGQALIAVASLTMVAVSIAIILRQRATFTVMLGFGALSWLIGNLIWLGSGFISASVPWWAGFLILTIAGERLELGRFVRISENARRGFAAILALFGVGLIATLFDAMIGIRIAGLGLIALAVWLFQNDLARRTVRSDQAITRFVAICMLTGYAWLGLGGMIWTVFGAQYAGWLYDASLHSLFLGFVFSMIFGHAPIIFPSVLGTDMKMRGAFYVHLGLLQLSLLLRVAGDLLTNRAAQQWGGLLNVIAILVFLANTFRSVRENKSISNHQLPFTSYQLPASKL
jgi:hypothetical protein